MGKLMGYCNKFIILFVGEIHINAKIEQKL